MSFYDRIRHREAASVAAAEPRGDGFGALRGHKYAVLVSYRRSGEAVPTPVWFGADGETVYVRTEGEAAKVKRVRRNPDVLLAPCTVRGKPLGPPVAGTARVVASAGEAEAEAALERNYGLGRRLYNRFAASDADDAAYIAIAPRAP
jgi:PPOX class probable F420-dependent enzyme